MAKPSKQFKKFASSGKLKETIQKRRSTQQARRKYEDRIAQRKKQRGAPTDEGLDEDDGDSEDEDDRSDRALGVGGRAGGVGKEVDELLKDDLRLAGPESEGDSEDEDGDEEEEDEEDELDEDDGASEEEEEDLEKSEEAMKKAMKQLEKNDPEFFKYLQQNDKDLLEFGDAKDGSEEDEEMDGADGEEVDEEDEEDDDEGDVDMDDEEEEERAKTPVTRKMLREWQEGMLKLHSIRSLRKTLLAFRAAAHMNEEDANEGEGSSTRYTINSPLVFNKLVITALKFTPVVVAHHIPYKTMPNGKIKVSQPKNLNPRLPKYILSHFSTILHFIRTLPATSSTSSTDPDTSEGGLLTLSIQESTKLLPWIISARKTMRAYLKVLLELWSSAPNDSVRIAAFLAVRKMFEGGDDAIKDQCLKQTYRALLPPLRNTTPHTLPSINLLKNTASELFLLSPSHSYSHAFTAIRMLAMHLRDVIRSTTLQSGSSSAGAGGAGLGDKDKGGKGKGEKGTDKAEAFRRVYNWQYVHCVDFWGRVLGGAAVREREHQTSGKQGEGKDELGMLVYPFVQVALGVIRLLPSPRYFPLHFHILSTLLTLCSQSSIYIPLSPYLLDILSSSEFRPTSTPRKSTLKPLDLEYVIRAPATYPRTRIYQETLGDELVYLLASYHAELVSSIAFPEIILPVILLLKKQLKRAASGGKGKGMSAKVAQGLKGLVDKLEAQKKWSEEKRRNVGFAPRDRAEVGRWEVKVQEEKEKTPLGMWVKTMRKVRDRKREEVEKALRGEE